ncbi:MAG TPA: hypothetical protein ENG67_04745 [candidate division WOR-3 bacterium]|uniref:Fibronectin type-III domain-containing protein n=1 Tax=candidate division WOR-3 bacterium TaxID=2052148 RepID=A0A7C0XDA7_UNCW3|nr:hypothetical protein [candidate division WOR-3 bacterium]
MLKKLVIIPGAILAALFIFSGCTTEETEILPPENLQYTVTSDGSGLSLTWDAVADADGYRVYVDDDLIYDGTSTSYTVANVGKEIGVSAYKGDLESDRVTIDVAPVTSSLTIYERSSTGQSAMGWNSDGVAVSYSLLDTANFANFHLYLDDFTPGQVVPAEIHFVAPSYNSQGVSFNDIETGFKLALTTSLDSISIADPVGSGYVSPYTQDPLVVNAVYHIWVDTQPYGELNTGDHFAKVKVIAIGTDGSVQLQCVYQKVSMLRWLPTP